MRGSCPRLLYPPRNLGAGDEKLRALGPPAKTSRNHQPLADARTPAATLTLAHHLVLVVRRHQVEKGVLSLLE